MPTSDINASGSSDTTALTGSPYGVGDYGAYSGAPTQVTNSAQVSAPSPGSSGVNLDPLSAPDNSVTVPGSQTTDASSATSGDWSSILSGLGSILTSPLGSAATMIGLGEYEASQAQSQTAALTGQLTGPAQPFVQGGVNELNATNQGLTGQPVTTGSIGQQELAAQEQGNAAVQYSTGQLTPAQQQQVQQQVTAQQQNIRQQLASQGITDSSVIAGYDQQIQDNATQLTQQLTQQNLQMGQQALASVQTTYSNLLNQSISQFGAGMGPIEDAVNLTVQSNTAIANGLQTLFGQIARGFSGAAGSTSGTAGLTSGLNSVLKGISSLLGGGSSGALPLLNSSGSTISGSAADTGNLGDQGIGTTDINTGAPGTGLDFSTGSIDLSGAGADATDAATTAATDDSGDLNSLLSDLGFSGAGGQAAAVAGSAAATGNLGSDMIGAPNLSDPSLGDLSTYNNINLSGAPASTLSAGLGIAGSAFGVYSNLTKGGVAGDATAAIDASKLVSGAANLAGDTALSQGISSGLSDLAPGLAAINFAKNWESGATGPDALSGAIGGAEIAGPLGAVIGGAVGAASSAFGGGKPDPETLQAEAIDAAPPAAQQQALSNPNTAFTYLAGVFDGKNNTPGHSTALEQVFGRGGEGALITGMQSQISSALSSGQIQANATPDQIYSTVVAPWLSAQGAPIDANSVDAHGNAMGQTLVTAIQSLIANYQAHGYGPGAINSGAQDQQSAQQQTPQALSAGMPGADYWAGMSANYG